MIVVDTNVIACLWFPGQCAGAAERVRKKDRDWVVPMLWRSEFRSALAGYIRHDMLDVEAAAEVMAEAESLMRGKEHLAESDRVLALIASSSCSAYDCEFVALAQDLGVPLITADRQIVRAFPAIAIPLSKFGAA